MRFVPGWRRWRVELSILRTDTAAAAENWFYFVRKGRPDGSWLVNQINFSHYPNIL